MPSPLAARIADGEAPVALPTGVVAALLAQGAQPAQGAAAAAWLHAVSGERCAHKGSRGLLAGDLLALLPPLMAQAYPRVA